MAYQSYGQALRVAAGRLQHAGVASPEWDARILCAHLIHIGHMDIPLDQEPIPGFEVAFEALVSRREAREPLQHILGVAWFGPLELAVGPGVFIPRPETEVLADWAVRQLAGVAAPRVVDLCTGSGALAAYVAHYVPAAQVWAVELADTALAYARSNLAGSGVELLAGDACAAATLADLDGTVDLIITNPPYVPRSEDLQPEVYADPDMAVFGGADGMEVIRELVPTLERLLAPGGQVGIEHDDATADLVCAQLAASGSFGGIGKLKDLTGRERFVTAVRR
ncbi:peptide chain release factor N(5)-glutamine methyltransferase [Corynebacterium lizhenjunii]|uniref:peptide chain release factor N(5)-glutamine methyltransferase n=1 Tax=Corynebacterium lizhenjunii TaxID=2709394 RepID=UPI0013ECF66E|nr:peptide chain release factor N(5)-glutamine methyltransferase [Corynebacterium lizhenjunii]